MLTPTEDTIMVPFQSKASVEDKKSDIEFFFRVILAWKDEENETNFASLSMKGKFYQPHFWNTKKKQYKMWRDSNWQHPPLQFTWGNQFDHMC